MKLVAIAILALLVAGCATPTNEPTPASSTPVSTPATTTPTTTRSVEFEEDFDTTAIGALPAGWTAAAGTWKVEANATAPSSPNVLRQSATDLPFPYAVATSEGTISDGGVSVRFNVLSGEKAQAGGVTFRFVDKDNNYVARANGNEGNFALFHTIGGKREKLMEAESPTGTNTWLSVRAEFSGKTISVYSGAAKLFTFEETAANAPMSGAVGVWTKDDSVTLFDDFLAEGKGAAASTPAAGGSNPAAIGQDFDRADVGGIPAGWTIVNGTWKVETNATAPTAANVLRQSATDLPFPVIVDTQGGNFTDVEVSTRFNVLSGEKAQAGGVVFRFQDDKNYYVARANGNEANFAIFHTIDGKREKMAEGEAPTGLNTWLTVRVEAKGDNITIFAGATKVVSVTETNAAAPKSGLVGLWTKDDSVVLFDNFEAESI